MIFSPCSSIFTNQTKVCPISTTLRVWRRNGCKLQTLINLMVMLIMITGASMGQFHLLDLTKSSGCPEFQLSERFLSRTEVQLCHAEDSR